MRLVRIMQADPQLGILQSLVIGLPSTSAFARVFQFGMRLAMRSYTIGSAWWQGDCGPYWGHNAIIRLQPFMAHCELPMLTGRALVKGHVLSHDQIEAVLMRRAGYEVRVLAEEGASFEQNPPTLIEFVGRDLRWCQGNMQYWHFLLLPGLKPVSRYQLVFALLMFLGSPAWIGLLVIGTLALASAGSAGGVHPCRCRTGAVPDRAGDVVRAEDRDRHRRADAAVVASRFRRRAAVSDRRDDGNGFLPAAVADHVVRPYGLSRPPAARPIDRLERAGA